MKKNYQKLALFVGLKQITECQVYFKSNHWKQDIDT